jgi:hypothetical protein
VAQKNLSPEEEDEMRRHMEAALIRQKEADEKDRIAKDLATQDKKDKEAKK